MMTIIALVGGMMIAALIMYAAKTMVSV